MEDWKVEVNGIYFLFVSGINLGNIREESFWFEGYLLELSLSISNFEYYVFVVDDSMIDWKVVEVCLKVFFYKGIECCLVFYCLM